jgi:ActR/RegA family two-component response regulator
MAGRRLTRLLLVDNNPQYIDPVRDRLIDQGWRADIAGSPEEALRKIREERYHLCILDKRLRDDHSVEDTSGVDLIPELWGIDGLLHFLLLTGYDEAPEAARLTRATFPTKEHWCDGYIAKKSGIEALLRELERVESEVLTLNWDLKIEEAFLEAVLEPMARETAVEQRATLLRALAQDTELLFQWVFYDRPRNLRLELLDAQGRSGARVIRATADDNAGLVLKLATRLAVEEEWENYVAQVRPVLNNRPDVTEGRCQVGRHLGVIAYSRVAGIDPDQRLQDLQGFLNDPETSADAAAKALSSAVRIMRPWMNRERTTTVRDLTAYYNAHFPSTDLIHRFEKLDLAIENVAEEPSLKGEHIGGEVMSPLPFAARTRFLVESDWNICHGDLNASNILMPEGTPWVIDFASTGVGPTCLDWVTLEVSLKFGHPWEATPETWFRFEDSLVQQELLDQPPGSPEGLGADLQRLFAALTTLRAEVARQAKPRSGMLEYLVGLLYATLYQVRFHGHKKFRSRKAYRILTSAGLIAERLAGMGVNRSDIGLLYSWRASGNPAVETRGEAGRILATLTSTDPLEALLGELSPESRQESLRIAYEQLIHTTLSSILKHGAPGDPNPDLDLHLQQLRALKGLSQKRR